MSEPMSSEFVMPPGRWSGWRLRVRRRIVEAHSGVPESRWARAPLSLLARAYGAAEGPWPWLAERGVERPSISGTTQPETERKRGQLLLRLAPDVVTRLRALAAERGESVSALVAGWVERG